MAGHKPMVHQDNEDKFYARCKCGWTSGTKRFLLKWQAEDTIRGHEEQVARAMAALRHGRTTLKSEMAHAERKIADPETSAHDRCLWEILMTGYRSRLREDSSTPEGLW